jgi:type I restriction enzyme, S subunit
MQNVQVEQASTTSARLDSLVSTDLPPGWQRTRLGDVCGLRTESVQPDQNPGARYVGLEHMDSGSPVLSHWGDQSEVTSTKARFHPGDVLYGKLRPYLDKAALAEWAGICSTDILVLKPGRHLVPDFLAYVLHTGRFVAHAVSSSRGVNHPRTSWSSLCDYEVLLPTLAEQVAIAHILSNIQDAKNARELEAALERERKAALMQHLFTHGTRAEPTKLTEIGEMPESWQVWSVRDMAEVAYGLTVNEARRTSTRAAPYLTVANVTRGALRLQDVKQIGMVGDDGDRYRLAAGDVLLVEGNGNPKLLGSAATWSGELPFALHQNHLIRVRPNARRVLSAWLMNYMNSDGGRAQLLGRSKTSSGLHSINSHIVSDLLIPLPALAEQHEVVQAVQSCDAYLSALECETTLLDELFRALLEELMTGRLSTLPLVTAEAGVPA